MTPLWRLTGVFFSELCFCVFLTASNLCALICFTRCGALNRYRRCCVDKKKKHPPRIAANCYIRRPLRRSTWKKVQSADLPPPNARIIAYCDQSPERFQNAASTTEANCQNCDDKAQARASATSQGSQYYALGKKAQSCDQGMHPSQTHLAYVKKMLCTWSILSSREGAA